MCRYHYGRLLSAQGSWSVALPELAHTLSLEPSCWQCHVAVAEAYEALKQPQPAAAMLQIASTLHPDSVEVRCRLGAVMLALGNINSAATSFDIAWTLSSKQRQAHQQPPSLQRPLPVLSADAVEQPSNDTLAMCWNNGAVASLTLGYVEDGVLWLKEALRLKPHMRTALQNLKMTLDDGMIDRIGELIASDSASKSNQQHPKAVTPADSQAGRTHVHVGVKSRKTARKPVNDDPNSALEQWLGTIVDGMRLLSDDRHSTSGNQNASVTASASVQLSLSPSVSSTYDVVGLLGIRRFATPSPWLWDAALALLPQQQPVPVDAAVKSPRRPPPPPPMTSRPQADLDASANGATASVDGDGHVITPADNSRGGRASSLSRYRSRRTRQTNRDFHTDAGVADDGRDDENGDSDVLLRSWEGDADVLDDTSRALRPLQHRRSCIEIGRDCNVRDINSLRFDAATALDDFDTDEGIVSCSPGQLAVLWFQQACLYESASSAHTVAATRNAIKCYEAAVVAAKHAVISRGSGNQHDTELQFLRALSDGVYSQGSSSSSSVGWSSVVALIEIRLAQFLINIESGLEALMVLASAASHANANSAYHLQAVMLAADVVGNASITTLQSKSVLNVIKLDPPSLQQLKLNHWLAIAAKHHPQSALALHRHGSELYRLGSYEDAANMFRAVIELQPTNAVWHHLLGCSLYELGQWESAAAALNDSLIALSTDADSAIGACSNETVDRSCGSAPLSRCLLQVTRTGDVCVAASSAIAHEVLLLGDVGLLQSTSGNHSDAVAALTEAAQLLPGQGPSGNGSACRCDIGCLVAMRLALSCASSGRLTDAYHTLRTSPCRCWLLESLLTDISIHTMLLHAPDGKHAPFGSFDWLSSQLSAITVTPPVFDSSFVVTVPPEQHQSSRTTLRSLRVYHQCTLGVIQALRGRFSDAVVQFRSVATTGSAPDLCSCMHVIERSGLATTLSPSTRTMLSCTPGGCLSLQATSLC